MISKIHNLVNIGITCDHEVLRKTQRSLYEITPNLQYRKDIKVFVTMQKGYRNILFNVFNFYKNRTLLT